MMFNRYAAKMAAKASMRSTYPHPVLVGLIYWLATSVLFSVLYGILMAPFFTSIFSMTLNSTGEFADPEMLLEAISLAMGWMGILYLVMFLFVLYQWVMNFGFTSYSLRLARGEQPGYRNLLDGFSMLGRALLVNFLTSLFAMLWGLVGLVPYMIFIVIALFTESSAMLVLAVLSLLVGAVLECVVLYRYRLATYFILDNPTNMGALEAIRRSKTAMKGWKGSLFVLDLSFLGWGLLSLITWGLLDIWLTPYRCATDANFYDLVVHGAFGPAAPPSGGPQGGPDDGERPELTF